MSDAPIVANLASRAVVLVSGTDWRSFLQGLLTQDVATLEPGGLRFAGLLTPQGRLLFDLFLVGRDDGCLLDCAANARDALIQRLTLYRLRAKVEIASDETDVLALWKAPAPPAPWRADPRLPSLGFRGYGATPPRGAVLSDEAAFEAHRLAWGVPGPADFAVEAPWPIEANFDLLSGVDFAKGCFVGQETTSRMKRRGAIKSRMVPIAFEGPPPEPGAELLAGTLRTGKALSGTEGRAMALLRLDRLGAGPLTFPNGRSWRPEWPSWLEAVARPPPVPSPAPADGTG